MDWANTNIKDIAAALAKAQGEFEPAVKRMIGKIKGQTKEGKSYDYSYSYADLAEILGAVTSALSKNGIAVIQPSKVVYADRCFVEVQTVLLHTSGQVIAFDPFALRCVNDTPQAVGSTMTYARRYSLQSAVGIAPEQDDDGAAGQGGMDARERDDRRSYPQNQPPQQQRQQPPPSEQPPAERQVSREYLQLCDFVSEYAGKYPEVFPDNKAVWSAIGTVAKARNVTPEMLKHSTDRDLFVAITEPVLDAVRDFEAAHQPVDGVI